MSSKFYKTIQNNLLLIGILSGVFVGFAVGLALRSVQLSDTAEVLVFYPGEIVMRAMECCVLPLIITSFITGAASLNAMLNGKIALRTLSYFISTSFFNALIGIFLAVTIQPGVRENDTVSSRLNVTEVIDKPGVLDGFLDLGRNILPRNIFTALFQQTTTIYETPSGSSTFIRKIINRDGTNTLGLIVFTLTFGTVLGSMGKKAQHIIESLKVLDEVNLMLLKFTIYLGPIGVASIIADKVRTMDNIPAIIAQLGLFVTAVWIGVVINHLVTCQVIYFLLKRKNPLIFYWRMMPAIIMAFSTASSAVTVPVTLSCLEKTGASKTISHFVVPLGKTINKDGTALFIAIASVFIAQLNNIPLGLGQYANIVFTATSISVASAASPSAALALLLGVSMKEIALLFTVDWLLDRVRTTSNVLGDMYATVFVEHFSQEEIKRMQEEQADASKKQVIMKDPIANDNCCDATKSNFEIPISEHNGKLHT